MEGIPVLMGVLQDYSQSCGEPRQRHFLFATAPSALVSVTSPHHGGTTEGKGISLPKLRKYLFKLNPDFPSGKRKQIFLLFNKWMQSFFVGIKLALFVYGFRLQ
jgi:hypothetical protein